MLADKAAIKSTLEVVKAAPAAPQVRLICILEARITPRRGGQLKQEKLHRVPTGAKLRLKTTTKQVQTKKSTNTTFQNNH